jgi:hypothetical protein
MVTVASSAAWTSAVCYALSAADNASDPVYADGWQAGDNGGFGFTPWNFDSAYVYNGIHYNYAYTGIKAIDDGLQGGTHFSNPFNNIGRAWTIATGPEVPDDGAPHIGRGFDPLQVGQTLEVVFDNPTKRAFFKGYFVRLNGGTGGLYGNICNQGNGCTPGGTPVPMTELRTFEYFSYGQWSVVDDAQISTGVFDTNTAAAGAVLSVTRTGVDTYDMTLDSLGGGADFSASRTFKTAGAPVEWIEFVFLNPETDSGTPPTEATDFYISSMSISTIPEPSSAALLLGAVASLGLGRGRREE